MDMPFATLLKRPVLVGRDSAFAGPSVGRDSAFAGPSVGRDSALLNVGRPSIAALAIAPIALILASTLGVPTAAAQAPAAAQPAAPPKAAASPGAQPARGAPAKPKEPPPPPPPARLWLIAPSASAPWTLRIDNEGERPMRIAADARLLQLEIERGSADKRKKPKPVKCAAPASMRPASFPEKRALLLPPGYSYVEHFDPHLLCFGKDAAALTGGSVVRARLGWSTPAGAAKKAPSPPFIVESTDDPAAFGPARELTAPTLVLSYSAPAPAPAPADKPSSTPADKPSSTPADKPAPAPEPPPVVDANAPRIELTSERWSDAASPRNVTIGVTATNAGKRPMTVAIRPRMLELRIRGPAGAARCDASPPTDSVPRDLFRTLKAGADTSFKVLLKELCPDTAFQREGLYQITAVLHANEAGAAYNLDAYTAVITAENPTILRLQSAPLPFYSTAPKAIRTADLDADPEAPPSSPPTSRSSTQE